MYAKARQRGGAVAWAKHLDNHKDNDHVRIAEIRGLVAQDLRGAFTAIQAMASHKVKNPFLCLEICPAGGFIEPRPTEHPDGGFITPLVPTPALDERYTMADVLEACERMEAAYPELADNARVIVEHDKEGRSHWHVTWSRIKADGKAVNFKLSPHITAAKISYEMNNARGTPNPQALLDIVENRPRQSGTTPTLAQSRQAAKIGLDAAHIKQAIKNAFEYSDQTANGFKNELIREGFLIAQGDKRGFVAVHVSGEVFSLPRSLEVKAKALRDLLGDPSTYPTVSEAKTIIKTTLKDKADLLAVKAVKNQVMLEVNFAKPLTERMETEHQKLIQDQREERYNNRHLPPDEQEQIRLRQRQDLRVVSGGLAAWRKMWKGRLATGLGDVMALSFNVGTFWKPATLQDVFKRVSRALKLTAAPTPKKTNWRLYSPRKKPKRLTEIKGLPKLKWKPRKVKEQATPTPAPLETPRPSFKRAAISNASTNHAKQTTPPATRPMPRFTP